MQLKFSDLFEGLGSTELRYGARCEALSGRQVEMRGYLSAVHDGSHDVLLVNEPGACPDCTPLPVAALLLPGFFVSPEMKTETPVKLRGTLSFGFATDREGKASFLRLEGARIATGLPA